MCVMVCGKTCFAVSVYTDTLHRMHYLKVTDRVFMTETNMLSMQCKAAAAAHLTDIVLSKLHLAGRGYQYFSTTIM